MRALFFIALLPILGYAQDTIPVIDGDVLETLTESAEENNHDFYTLYENLESILKDPININKARREDLEELQLFSAAQIYELLEHRDTYGSFLSIYELQSLEHMDMATLRAALPFLSIGNRLSPENLSDLYKSAQHTMYTKYKRVLQERKGYTKSYDNGGYRGSPNHLYLRYKIDAGQKLRMALTIEKDPGEAAYTREHGIEYISGYAYARNPVSFLDEVVLGDYSISMGQGLIMHNSFGGGKSSYVMNIRKSGRPIKPYGSINEANYMRGLAASTSIGNYNLMMFASSKKIDGTGLVDSIIDTGFRQVSSINISGLHRTANEYLRKHNLRNSHMGATLSYHRKDMSLSANIVHTHFHTPIQHHEALYKRYTFSGSSLTNASIDYSYRWKNMLLFGESALSNNGGHGHLHGMLASLGRYTDASIVYRSYSPDYQVLQANAFAESSLPINEYGVYLGMKIAPIKRWTISAYYDLWKHPWLRYQKDGPTQGKEYLVKLEYYKKRKMRAYIQYRFESKSENHRIKQKSAELDFRNQHRARIHLAYKATKSLEIRKRIEMATSKKAAKNSTGYMSYIDLIYKPIELPLSFTTRYALFDTDDFSSRIYAYENDILYEFSIPFFAGNGSRFYLNTRYKVNRWLTAEAHYGITWYHNTSDDVSYRGIGSGNEHIQGDVQEEVKLQVKLKF